MNTCKPSKWVFALLWCVLAHSAWAEQLTEPSTRLLTQQQEADIAALEHAADIARWEQAVPERVTDKWGQARAFSLLGQRWEAIEQPSAAFNSYDAAVALLEPAGASAALVQALTDRSYTVYTLTGDPARYCPGRAQAVVLARTLGDPEVLVDALVSHVFCYRSADELNLGLADLDEALALATESGMTADRRAMISNASGNLLRSNNLHDLAYDAYHRAYLSWREADDTSDSFSMLHALTGEAMQLGRWDVAEQHIAEMFSMAAADDADRDFEFFALFNAGRVALAQTELKAAGRALNGALALRHTTDEHYFVARAHLLRTFQRIWIGQPASAREDLEQARQYGLLDDASVDPAADLVQALIAVENPQALTRPIVKLLHQLHTQQRNYMDRNARAASSHQERQIAAYESQLLKQQLDMQALELARAEGQARLARQTAVSAGLLIALLLISLVAFFRSWKRQRARAHTDYLTGISNRARVFQLGFHESRRAIRARRPLAVILLDIDNFKAINDAHGHSVGDQAIRCTAQAMQAALCSGERLGRLGGEEFLVLVPGATLSEALQRAESIRAAVESLSILPPGDRPLALTVSAGVDAATGCALDFEALVHRADRALYLAKARGRNRVVSSAELTLAGIEQQTEAAESLRPAPTAAQA